MMWDDLDQKIEEYIQKIPSLPTSVAKVLEICNNPQISPADLNYVISLDPVLVGRVLKLLNSAYYGLSQKVTNMVRAIIMLGINTVKNLVLSTSIMGTLSMSKKRQGLDMEGFWRHSLCVGVAAKLLAKQRGVDPKRIEEYFTAGLLHDIGKIPLNGVLSGDYMLAVTAADRDRISLFRAEDAALGLNHCAAGAMIVKAWKLSGPVGETIVHHHNIAGYTGNSQDILYSIAVANQFAVRQEIGFSGDRFPEKTEKEVWETLQIGHESFEEIEKTVLEEIEKAQVFLKMA
jgi:putative nucleotidyltransferase with HDIG domain